MPVGAYVGVSLAGMGVQALKEHSANTRADAAARELGGAAQQNMVRSDAATMDAQNYLRSQQQQAQFATQPYANVGAQPLARLTGMFSPAQGQGPWGGGYGPPQTDPQGQMPAWGGMLMPPQGGQRNVHAAPVGPQQPQTVGGGRVLMRAPTGTTKMVSPDQVDHFRSLGAVVVNR